MDGTEIDTFIFKFKQLWKSGLIAHLDLDTKDGQAWVGLRVRLGHAPGPLHQQENFHYPQRTRNCPSRLRRRARRAAERQEKAEEFIKDVANENESEKVPVVMHEIENVVVETALDVNDVKSVAEEATKVILDDAITDEFCPNEEYSVEDLNIENSVTFWFIITDSVLSKSLAEFKRKVTINFEKNKVKECNRSIEITGYEQLANESKFFMKVKD